MATYDHAGSAEAQAAAAGAAARAVLERLEREKQVSQTRLSPLNPERPSSSQNGNMRLEAMHEASSSFRRKFEISALASSEAEAVSPQREDGKLIHQQQQQEEERSGLDPTRGSPNLSLKQQEEGGGCRISDFSEGAPLTARERADLYVEAGI